MKKLLAGWGVDIDASKVAADITHARRVQFGAQAGRPSVTEYVAWLNFDRRAVDDSEAIAAGVETLNMASVGHRCRSPTRRQSSCSRWCRPAIARRSSMPTRSA